MYNNLLTHTGGFIDTLVILNRGTLVQYMYTTHNHVFGHEN